MTLIELEKTFQQFLLSSDPSILSHIHSTENIPHLKRLNIYANAYTLRLQEALTANFPALEDYLGHAQFDELTQGYIKAYSSQFKSIRWYGDHLATFLVHTYPAFPALAELAALEWSMGLVFDAQNSEVISIETMASIDPAHWSNMTFKLIPALQIISCHWNVVAIWQAVLNTQTPPDPVREKTTWALWRQMRTSQYVSLSEDEVWALNAMRRGDTFAQVCEGLCQWLREDQVGLYAAGLLKKWIQAGMIAQVMFA